MEDVEEVKKKSKGNESQYGKRCGVEFKLRCVKLRLEEGLPVSWLSKEVGASKDVIRRWVKAFFGVERIYHLLKRAFFLSASFRQLRNGFRT